MAAQRKPNLILFLPDQQRADTLACYGAVKVHAPNLNKLASESVILSGLMSRIPFARLRGHRS